MKEAYILHDTQEQLNDIIILEKAKAQRIVNLTNRRITMRTAYIYYNKIQLDIYDCGDLS